VNHHYQIRFAIVLNSGEGLNLGRSNAQKTQTERASKTEGWGGSEWTGFTLVQGEALIHKVRLHIPVRSAQPD
jgi:hypothetical protein